MRGLGGHFCFDFFRLRLEELAAISEAVFTTTGAEMAEATGNSCGVGSGGGGGVAVCITRASIRCGCTGAADAGSAGDEHWIGLTDGILLVVVGADALVATPVILIPSSEPSWLGDKPPTTIPTTTVKKKYNQMEIYPRLTFRVNLMKYYFIQINNDS